MTTALVEIVDDDPPNQKLLRVLAESAGFRTRAHTTAEAALIAMRTDPPAIAAIDVQLAGRMDGLELTRILKSAPETSRIIVIVVSAFAALADEARARAAGADVWMPKPIDTRELVALLRNLAASQDPDPRPPAADPYRR